MNSPSTTLLRLIDDPPSDMSSGEPEHDHTSPVLQLPLEQIVEPDGEHAVRRTYDAGALEDLAVSLRLHGLLHPVGVRPLGPDRYALVWGSRRLRAAKLAGWTSITATLRLDLDNDADQTFVLNLAENLQRAQLGGAELAAALRVLASLHTSKSVGPHNVQQPNSAAGLARRLGVDKTTVGRWIGVARQPELLEAVETGTLDLVRAARVATAPHEDVVGLLHEVLDEELSQTAIDLRLRELRGGRRPPTANVKHLRVALAALETIQSVDGDVEAELIEQVARQMARIRRLSPWRSRRR